MTAVGRPVTRGTAPSPGGTTAPTERSTLRAVALPAEHGGWSLTLEPVLLGLLVAWSLPGLALGGAAMLAFVARTPLKVVLVDLWRHRWLSRSTLAVRVAAIELVAMVGLVAYAASAAREAFWPPLALAAPLVVVELWFDMRSRGRRLVPELAGTVGIGSVAAAVALAGGLDSRSAIGLWCVVAARGGAAIPYVRTQIARLHRRPISIWPSDLAQLVGVVAVAVAVTVDAVPAAALVAVATAGALNVVAVRVEPRPAKVIGIQQMLVGIAVILAVGMAHLAG
jgi:hypothetical protein